MEEEFILQCKQDDNSWKCPVMTCGKILSRKQTLKSHIVNQHNVEAGKPVKRYKLYESQLQAETSDIPRATLWRHKKRKKNMISTTDHQVEQVMDTGHTLSDFTAEILTTQSDKVFEHDMENDMEMVYDSTDEILFDSNGENTEYLISDSDTCISDSESLSTEQESELPEIEPEIFKHKNEEPPIYVLSLNETVYRSKINLSEHSLAVSAFATRHNLSDVAISDMLQLIQLHLPDNNIAETSTRKLKESCGFDSSYLMHHLYCEGCKKLFDTQLEQCITPGCQGTKTNAQCTKYFVSGKIEIQLKEILQRDGVWTSIEESRSCITENISDIKGGLKYKKLQEPGGFLHNTNNITLSLFIDGIPLFKSSSVSLWPVYLLVNEIPPKERFSRKNMILWGIWQGVGKPKMNMFLRPLVFDLVDLYENGITFSFDQMESEVTIKAMLIIATMDLQARSYVLMITMHNGEYGCLYCKEKGKTVPSGKGHCRAYLSQEQSAAARSDEDLKNSSTTARLNGKKTDGMLGQSVLWFLPYFSFTENVVIDYMHGTLLGVTKKMLELWFDKAHATEPYNITGKMSDIDKDLRYIKPLYIVHRLPRILTGTYQNWKASELRNWLLFYALPCLKEKLPDIYLTHFSCLAEAVYILLQEGITHDELKRAEILLHTYVANVQRLYGERFMSLNVHNLTHMANCVKLWGPLWAWSCFCFESFNGEIKKSIHGTGNVCKQIFWTLQSQKRIAAKAKQLQPENKVRNFMENALESKSERFSKNSEAFQCSVIKLTPVTDIFSDEIKEQLLQQTGVNCVEKDDFISVAKIARNGYLMYSKSCSKVKKQNSYTIRLNKALSTNDAAIAVEVLKYLMENQSRRVFAIGRLVVSSGSILPRRVSYLQKISYIGEDYNTVVPVEYLGQPMMVVNTRKEVFAALLPNNIERD